MTPPHRQSRWHRLRRRRSLRRSSRRAAVAVPTLLVQVAAVAEVDRPFLVGRRTGSTACSTSPSASTSDAEEASAASARAEVAALRTELARANAHIGALERALERRESEHRNDLDALERAEREAAASHRTLMSERSWVQSLDEMRLDDLSTIMQLEMRLQQWQTCFER